MTGSEPGPGTVWVDVSDLLMFLSHHAVVSGIQRVIVEVLPHLEELSDCEFVAFDSSRTVLVRVDSERVRALLSRVRHESPGGPDPRTEARSLRAGLSGQPALSGAPGDVLAVLGAGWSFPGLFAAIRRLKDQGVAVVVLLYDLIPVVFPGFPEAVVAQFREYLPRVAALADRAPAISAATRRDFETYCGQRGWPVPDGRATGLAGDQWSPERIAALGVDPGPAWPRPFVLFVSTVEVRKNHILALRCWRRLINELGADAVPDLVCVGRLGWNAFDFLAELRETEGLGGRIHLLTDSLTDARLAALYRDCLFTVYPSRYEGWGLPVGESLDMGKPVVAARNSSLPEVGGDLAAYFDDDDLEGFVAAARRYLDADTRAADAARIAREHRAMTWQEVAAALRDEIDAARARPRPVHRDLELGKEYGTGALHVYHGDPMGQAFLDFLDAEQRLPLTGQYMGVERSIRSEILVDQPAADADARVTMQRPAEGDLHLVVSLARGLVPSELTVTGPAGGMTVRPSRGGLVRVPLGTGPAGELITVGLARAGGRRRHLVRSFLVVAGEQAADELVRRGPVARPGLARSAGALRARRALSGGPSEVVARVRRRFGR